MGSADPRAEALSGPWAGGGPANEGELRFRRRPMVRWLNPRQLAGTAVRAVLSDVFGAYADQREMQAALTEPGRHDYSDRDEVWIDYVADLGDGFDSTYTVAWLLGRERLRVPGPNGRAHDLPRGRVLVMGGDQVYPTASRQEYTDRMEGPYEAALPCLPPDAHPDLFAIPGNHDWYDGLTSFMRQFCQGRWIGGWKTEQRRSYFALKLPHGWWLLGTDLQLHADIDKPQLEYFAHVAREQMQPGDRVILCTPEPAWVHAEHDRTAFDNLAFFEQQVLADHGVSLALTLAGDLHHYARYADAAGQRHKVTSGGGGAYLYGTHRLPHSVCLDRARVKDPAAPTPADEVRTREVFTERKVYPGRGASRALRWGGIRGVLTSVSFTSVLAGLYLLYAWVMQASVMDGGRRFIESVAALPLSPSRAGEVAALAGQALRYNPLAVVLTLLILGSMVAFCAPDLGRWKGWKVPVGLLHGAAHVALAVGLTWGVARLGFLWLGAAPTPGEVTSVTTSWEFVALFVAAMLGLGGLLGGTLMGLFLLPGVNLNEAFSAQALPHYRNFLRLHVDAAGGLTVYPVGVRRSVTWKLRPNAPAGEPFFVPAKEAPAPELIEEPIVLGRGAPRRKVALGEAALVGEPDSTPTGKDA